MDCKNTGRQWQYRLNYKLDKKVDPARLLLKTNLEAEAVLPPSFSLRDQMPPVRDQGQLGACTAFATGAAFEFCLTKQKIRKFKAPPSHLFLYYNGRVIGGGPVAQDTGLTVAEACKSAAEYGACPERMWPYIISEFATQPSQKCYTKAAKFRISNYVQVPQTLQALKHTLVDGFPVIFGILVYSSFMSDQVARTGIVPMPNTTRESLEGGHCVLLIGYDDVAQRFTCMNSWSTGWGDQGFFSIPYDYVLHSDLASDFWSFKAFS